MLRDRPHACLSTPLQWTILLRSLIALRWAGLRTLRLHPNPSNLRGVVT